MTAILPPVRRTGLVAVVAAVAVVAVGVRFAVLLAADGLLGSSAYDDGVYFAAGAALAHGRWPYADVLLLHPPGIVLALAPFGALGALVGDPAAVVVARLVWIGIGGAGCALVAVLAGRRSIPAGLVAGAGAACLHPLAFGERSTLIEPLGTLLLLVALLVGDRGGRRAAVIAGAVAGLSLDLKIWYVVPVLVLLLLARHRLRFLLGAVVAAAVVALPFLLRAPDAMVRQVVLDQLGRPTEDDTLLGRVAAITGASWFGDGLAGERAFVPSMLVLAVVVVAAALAWRTPIGRRAVLLLAGTAAVLLASPSFFAHYVAYTGPWLALVLGVAAGEALGPLRSRSLVVGGTVALAAAVVVPTLRFDLLPPKRTPSIAAVAIAAQRVDGCIRSDDPGLLAAMGVLSSQLARGCALRPDVTGYSFDRPGLPARAADRAGSERWQRFVTGYLLGGDAVIVARDGTGLSAESRRRIAALPVLARSGPLVLHAVPR